MGFEILGKEVIMIWIVERNKSELLVVKKIIIRAEKKKWNHNLHSRRESEGRIQENIPLLIER